jgi:ATP-dependent protease ClpP protease subunit
MASWAEIQKALNAVQPLAARGQWLEQRMTAELRRLEKASGRNVIIYASGYLQKPQVSGAFLAISPEDINGFMTCVHNMDCKKGLLLLLHTPGGSAEAAETIVAYLWSKFDKIDVLIPTYAMSAGTMIAMAADNIIMGRQSQLGPTDPQIIMNNVSNSAHSIVEQFEEAKREISKNPALAGAWVPILQPFGPALLQHARKALSYGQKLVTEWLEKRMLSDRTDALEAAKKIAAHFGGAQHGSHGHRIDRDEARKLGLKVKNLEDDAELQDAALTAYHLVTTGFEHGPMCKIVSSTNGDQWIKNIPMPQLMPFPFIGGMPPGAPPAQPAPAAPSKPGP